MNYIIAKRNKNYEKDQEYKIIQNEGVLPDVAEKTNMLYTKITESEIIRLMNTNKFYTKNTDKDITIVEKVIENDTVYIKSVPNGTTEDNLLKLPKY